MVGVAVTAHTEGKKVKLPDHFITPPPVAQLAKVTRRSRAMRPHLVGGRYTLLRCRSVCRRI